MQISVWDSYREKSICRCPEREQEEANVDEAEVGDKVWEVTWGQVLLVFVGNYKIYDFSSE